MKKIKNALLSVLLFSFTFLVVHDYMMADLGISSYSGESISKVNVLCETTSDSFNAVSHLHESIHIMITMDSDETINTALILDSKPSYIESSFASNNNFVLERPPLS